MERAYAVQKIFELHQIKEYLPETAFKAVNIFDHYIDAVGLPNFPKQHTLGLAVISLLVAAKI